MIFKQIWRKKFLDFSNKENQIQGKNFHIWSIALTRWEMQLPAF